MTRELKVHKQVGYSVSFSSCGIYDPKLSSVDTNEVTCIRCIKAEIADKRFSINLCANYIKESNKELAICQKRFYQILKNGF